MTSVAKPCLVALVGLCLLGSTGTALSQSGRIYGVVTTRSGDVFEGRIRWDDHETGWEDILDANRSFYSDYAHSLESPTVRIFGIRVRKGTFRRGGKTSVEMGVKFGHLRSIERLSSNSALLVFKSGREMKVQGSGTDIGNGNRGIFIQDLENGTVELRWRDLDTVEFIEEPRSYGRELDDESDNRLCGKVTAWQGDVYEGAIMWDNDETLGSDVLDGEERGRDFDIEFADIRSIERDGRRACRVELCSDRTRRLSGSNDVNNENRGIIICGPRVGQVVIQWPDFERVEFEKPSPKLTREYEDFDGGRPLHGVVETEGGKRYEGKIRWDDDEEYTCDLLDGEDGDIDFEIEFGNIKRIERRSSQSAVVELVGGRKLTLRGSNDVNDENKGIFIDTGDGEEIRLSWSEFREVVFK